MREHVKFICNKQDCYPCQWCDGGLFACIICGGAEGSLTTECCGRQLTEQEERRIYTVGDLNFRNGQWVNEPNYPRTGKLTVAKVEESPSLRFLDTGRDE